MTLGKFGPNIGIDRVEAVIRLNNICNDLGLDTASTGSAIAWAMELYQRGIITTAHTGGIELTWGNAEAVEELLFMTGAPRRLRQRARRQRRARWRRGTTRRRR